MQWKLRSVSAVSWEFNVSAENIVDPSRITPGMEEFANSVRFKRPPLGVSPEVSACRIFTCSKGLPIVGIEQKTTLKYRLKNHGSSVFELARYDEYNDADEDVSNSTQWGATLYDEEWDMRLQENAGLGIGQMASWEPLVDHFFTPNYQSESKSADAGFKEFWQNVEKVATFIDTLKES